MATTVSPIDIGGPARFNSQSPRNQTSNLTSALQEAGATGAQSSAMNIGQRSGNEGRLSVTSRNDSSSNMLGSSYYSGARPISMKDRPRRESNTANSLVNGMSWGGVSVGSWIRDDMVMTGTSPSPYPYHQSPSYHSSSYLPKMEANFLRDYNCCGIRLDSLHELLQHFEENHAQQSGQITQRPSQSGQGGLGPASRSSGSIGQSQFTQFTVRGADPPKPQSKQQPHSQVPAPQRPSEGFNRTQLSTVQDVDTLEDMDMDDDGQMFPMAKDEPQQTPFQQQPQSSRPPQLNMNISNMQPHQGLRTATPTTPNIQQGFQLQNNPTVSSVNTPTLSTRSIQQGQTRTTPQSSMPGTPNAMDEDFSGDYVGGLPMDLGMGGTQDQQDWSNMNFGGAPDLAGLTINDPAKRLFSKQGGGGMTQQQLAMAIRNGQFTDIDPARRQQLLSGMNIAGVAFPEPENKPFKCPVIGCEKAYKNQNGLKYHKTHGHQNQQLRQNEDGTYSIVDPLTSVPYPGTVGMEKEKPYRCDVCGKRYKNLNGLKYHRQHSPHCNPDLKAGPIAGLPGQLQNLQGMNVNVAGAGLAGMGGDIGGF